MGVDVKSDVKNDPTDVIDPDGLSTKTGLSNTEESITSNYPSLRGNTSHLKQPSTGSTLPLNR